MDKIIILGNVPHKWQRLLLHLQNAVPDTFRCVFPDVETARDAGRKMLMVIRRRLTWFNMEICVRGCDVYVIKTDRVQKVVIRDV